MKATTLFLLVIVAALAGVGGWFAARKWPAPAPREVSSARKVLYYQSSMHPWIKSDKPGKCTICGMDLVPVYEGDKGFATDAGLVTLGSNSISVIGVQTAEIIRGPLHRTLRVAGTIDDDDTRHRVLAAYVDGRIDRLFVNFLGADVVEGQPLATIYSPVLLTAEREYVTLLENRPGSAGLQAEHARLVQAASLRLQRLGLTPSQIASLPHKPASELQTEILAPMSGTVVAREVFAGQYVKEGDKLFELADFSTMWFKFDAYERDLPWLKPGQSVAVTTPAVPGKVFAARIAFIDPNLNDPTRSAKVRVEIPNPLIEREGAQRRELNHRLYAEAAVRVDMPDVLLVPRSAVLMPGRQALIYLDKGGGTYEQRQLRLGRAGDDSWEVLEGLSAGDSVVTAGSLLIDAQAQLNQTANASTPESAPSNRTSAPADSSQFTPLSEPQRNAVRRLVVAFDILRAALSGDDLAGFNQQSPKVHEVLPELLAAFDNAPGWQPLIAQIETQAHLENAGDLKTARKAFYNLSSAMVDLVQKLRGPGGVLADVKVYQCPMLKQAFPGAPARGGWIQLEGPLRNPYFGAEMIDCGTEVKP